MLQRVEKKTFNQQLQHQFPGFEVADVVEENDCDASHYQNKVRWGHYSLSEQGSKH